MMLLRFVNGEVVVDFPADEPRPLLTRHTPIARRWAKRRVIRERYYTRNRPNVGMRGPARSIGERSSASGPTCPTTHPHSDVWAERRVIRERYYTRNRPNVSERTSGERASRRTSGRASERASEPSGE
ncbi:hypothetical protein GCM10009681_18910 [Luedemannella helvata]|uniref:Uncharacterized protein n=1 Tax=Luedemannella helvata TaxID=349315 RepID=A0ABP4W607_9ACTN